MREVIISILRRSGASFSESEHLFEAFVKGEADVPMKNLHIDSLSTMEICILLEDEHSVSISPQQFGKFKNLSDLEKLLEKNG